jgi:hypothetical protein
MKTTLLITIFAFCLALAGCGQTTTLQNGCVVDSIVYGELMKAQKKLDDIQVPFNVITGKMNGFNHAVCVFQWQNRQFIYDPLYGTHQVNRGLGSPAFQVIVQVYPDCLDAKWLH